MGERTRGALAFEELLGTLTKPVRGLLEAFLAEAKARGIVGELAGHGYLTLAQVELEGTVYLLTKVPGKVRSVLTKREKEVATLAAKGLSNKEIAQRLGRSLPTVAAHMQSIFKKLEITSRAVLGQVAGALTN